MQMRRMGETDELPLMMGEAIVHSHAATVLWNNDEPYLRRYLAGMLLGVIRAMFKLKGHNSVDQTVTLVTSALNQIAEEFRK